MSNHRITRRHDQRYRWLGLCSILLVACGSDRTLIDLGETVNGSVTTSDSHWTSCDPSNPLECNEGYADKYEIDVTAGVAYTITFSRQTDPAISFEDLEGGRITDSGNSTSNAFWAYASPGRWVPAKSGTNRIEVDAGALDAPASYTFTVTQGD